MNVCPSLVEIRSVTSKIKRRKKKNTAIKYKAFGIAMPGGLNIVFVAKYFIYYADGIYM